MKHKFEIIGIDCPNCADKLARLIEAEADIESAKINFLTEKLTVVTELEAQIIFDKVLKIAKSFDKGITVKK